MNPVMYIILNKSLGMSTGKAAAQAAHAAVEAYRISMLQHPLYPERVVPHLPAKELYETNAVRLWYKGGHYTKIVLETEGDLKSVSEYLHARGFNNALIIDEGRTEIAPFTPTAIGCAIVDKDNPHVQATFGQFPLYRDEPKVAIIELTKALSESKRREVRRLVEQGEVGMARDLLRESKPKRRWF